MSKRLRAMVDDFIASVSEDIGEGDITSAAVAILRTITSAGTKTIMIHELLEAIAQELHDLNYRATIAHGMLLIWRMESVHTVYLDGEELIVSRVGTDYPLDSAIVWQERLNLHVTDLIPMVVQLVNRPADATPEE